ncbi:MAG: RDD family protein [Propionibacteriaceae bacterium]|jgi:uncharacterized RDD family membrane protein YckC|nr:RDD family protein [Propionibacteriaceae bacterium]
MSNATGSGPANGGEPTPGYTPAPSYQPVEPPPQYRPAAPLPGYGQSAPAPAPLPGYGQLTPTYATPLPARPTPAPALGGQTRLADWPKRVQSALIDWGPIVALGVVSLFFSGVVDGLLALVAVAWGVYNIGFLGGKTGVTIGRSVAHTRLVREDTGAPLGAGPGIARYFLHGIDAVACGIGFLFPLFTPKKQTIADMIMKSVVVER